MPSQRAAPAHCDDNHTVRIQSGQDFGLLSWVSPTGQSSRLVVVGKKGVGVMQCRLDLVQGSRSSGPYRDIQHRLKAECLGFTKELEKVLRTELPHNHVAADIEDAGTVQYGEVNVLEAKVRVSTDGMKKSAVLAPNVDDVGAGGRMGGTSAHGG